VTLRYPDAVRPWQHVLEPLSGYLALAKALVETPATAPRAVNFGPDPASFRSVREVVDAFSSRFAGKPGWQRDAGIHPAEARALTLSSALAEQSLGWRPVLSIEESLSWTSDWYRAFAAGGEHVVIYSGAVGAVPKPMKCVILAGGKGTRIAEESNSRPKPMVEIGSRPILWHIMKLYASFGVQEFIVCLGYKGYMVKEYFANYFLHQADVTFDMAGNRVEYHDCRSEPWKVTLVDTGEETMTGGPLAASGQVLKRRRAVLHDVWGWVGEHRYRSGDGVSSRARLPGDGGVRAAAGALRTRRDRGRSGDLVRGEAADGGRPYQRRLFRTGTERARTDRGSRDGMGKPADGKPGGERSAGGVGTPGVLAADGYVARQAAFERAMG